MCLPMVACNKEEMPNTGNGGTHEQQGTHENNEVESTYPNASETESTKPETTEPENTEPLYETIEITLDNWNIYFEVVVTPVFKQNVFGEYDDFVLSHRIQLKDEYFPLLNADETEIAIEVVYSYVERECNVDFENLTYELGEVVRIGGRPSDMANFFVYGDRFSCYPFGIETYSNGTILYSYEDVEVVRIQGSLCLRIKE